MILNQIKNYLGKLFSKRKSITPDSFYNFEKVINHTWIFREQQIHDSVLPIQFRSSVESKLTFGEILSKSLDIRQEELSNLCIIIDGVASVMNESALIWNYDIFSPYISGEKAKSTPNKQVVYTLQYRSSGALNNYSDKSLFHTDGTVIIHTQSAGHYKNATSYINVTLCTPQFTKAKERKFFHGSTNDRSYINFVAAYDFKKTAQAKSEYQYIKENITSLKEKNSSALSDKEWLLLQRIDPDLGTEYYWGKKAFSESRYLDAICYFENVYHTLSKKWHKEGLVGKEMGLLTECSFLIGASYNHLQLYEKAYSYLEFCSKSTNRNHKYKKAFVNCLISSHNLFSIIYVDLYLKDIQLITKENRSEDDIHLFYFLMRRKAYILVEMEQYEDAESILHKLLENDPDNTIVLHELAYIQSHRQKEVNKEVVSEETTH